MKEIILKSKNFTVVRDTFPTGDEGVEKIIEFIEQPNVVIALPIMTNGDVILVEHVRPILNTTLIECPGGKVDPDEDLNESIIRELQEEIGYTPQILEYICYFYTSVGTSTEKIHVFVAKSLEPHSRNESDIKRMSVTAFSIPEIIELLNTEKILDAKSEIALFKYLGRIGRLTY